MLSMVTKDLLLHKCPLLSRVAWNQSLIALVTSSRRTRHLKISNIRQVQLLKIILQKLTITTDVTYKLDFLQQCITFNMKKVVV